MNIGYIIPIITLWHTISSEITKHKPKSVASNIVSFIHCVSFILHYNYKYNLEYVIHISIGFYIYDLFYLFYLIYKASNASTELKVRTPFIIHHIATVYVLHESLYHENQKYVLYAFDILEKSNIMLYISYHIHKEYTQSVRLNITADFLQLLFYSYYRVFELSLYIYNHTIELYRFNYGVQFLIVGIFCMGFAWTYKLVKRNIANYYKVKDRKI